MIFVVTFTSIWIWKILTTNLFLGILVLTSSIFLCKLSNRKRNNVLYFILFTLLLIFQYKTTSIKTLHSLTKQEEVLQIQRLKEYPPVYIPIGSKAIWIPAAHWLEGREESVVLMHMSQNFAEVIDPNFYFFANHPREWVGVDEFEKFSYVLLPFFLYGVYLSVKEKRWIIIGSALMPLFLHTIIGNNNPLGSFSLLPFFIVTISRGLKEAYEYIKHFSLSVRYTSLAIFLLIFSLVLLQLISYEMA